MLYRTLGDISKITAGGISEGTQVETPRRISGKGILRKVHPQMGESQQELLKDFQKDPRKNCFLRRNF